ncbi:MAG TPA: DUF3048 domain-containing protein [Candidatus Dormibacteraeota bacterium]|nr:DUF3048 domain-containing protein [Candidatus Dormibacteraeota bacterium]
MGAVVAVLFSAAGAYFVYENSLPTAVTASVKDGQRDVPTDTRLRFKFSRPVALSVLRSAITVTPATRGILTSVSGQTEYEWSGIKPLTELTTYTVAMTPITDLGHRHIRATSWTFTTLIVPRVVSITGAGGAVLADGAEIDPGTPLKINFNDEMEHVTIRVTLGTQITDLKWASDDRSASISMAGIPSGPIVIQLPPGGRDQTGHLVPKAFTLKTGVYFHDHEHTTPLKYPALIQVPNDEFARDQNGLQAADVVFEYLAEGGITRLTAIYQNVPDLVGPMRSSRFISLKIARHYKGLLFQSGESQATASRASGDPVPQFFDTIGYTFRTSSRDAPDNLMISGSAVNSAEGNFFSGIPAFTIPKARPTLTGGTAAATINVDEHYSTYSYDPVMGTYQKAEESHAYVDATSGQPLRIEMLIVLHTQETLLNVGDGHGAYIHDFNLDSSGSVDIFYKGMQYAGFWNSTDSHGPLTFTLADGTSLSLPPGLVWIDVTA